MKTLTIYQKKSSLQELMQCFAWFASIISPLVLLATRISEHRIYFHFLLLFAGWLSWTFTEYCQHRFDSHGINTKDTAWQVKLHQHHHRNPTEIIIKKIHRIALFILSITLVCLSVWLNNYFTFLTGYLLGFSGYTFMHWFLHRKISARLFPEIRRFHIYHHCKYPDKCFGVTVSWWDHLLGTVPDNNLTISDRILAFYYKKEKTKKTFSLNQFTDEKNQFTEKQSA
ncbi:MAG TPA: sterol desaturase family protein [Chitinophagaceae bacterium]|nr:sterol desaturase family protein [Chitinophagaceae bacterium]